MKHPLFVSPLGRFVLASRFVICLILLWGLALPMQAQVVVKERVEITSEGVPVVASASKQSGSVPRRGPLQGQNFQWSERYHIDGGPTVGFLITRTGYLTLGYKRSQWFNVAPQGEVRVEIQGDSLLRTVTDAFSLGNFAEETIVDSRRCVGIDPDGLSFQYSIYETDFTDGIFQNDTLEIGPDFAVFQVGKVYLGDSLRVTFVTETGEHGNQFSIFGGSFEYSRSENACVIDESFFRWEGVTLSAFFEWTIDHFAISGPLPYKPVLPKDSTNFTVLPRHENDDPVEPFPGRRVRMELDAEGARLGYLRGPDGATGASLDLDLEDANEVWYVAENNDPAVIVDPQPVKLTVSQIGDPGADGEFEFYVGGHTYTVTVEPDTVDFGETGQVTITAIDIDSMEVTLPEATPLLIFTPRNTLIAPDSSVLSPVLFEIPYGAARSGLVRFKTTDPLLLLNEPTLREEEIFTIYFDEQLGVVLDGSGTVTTRNDPRLELEFDKDPDTYLPIKNDLIEVTATITPAPPPGSMVTFELVQADDFTFADSTVAPKMEEVVGKEAKVMIKSQEYWGVVTVKATLVRPGKADLDDEQQLPLDTDNDGIADSWELDPANGGTLAKGGSNQDGNWDDETSPGNTNDGDGLTKLDEYKGALDQGNHLRLTPEMKEVIFDVTQATHGQFAIQEVEQQLGIDVIETQNWFNFRWLGNRAGTPSIPGRRGIVRVIEAGVKEKVRPGGPPLSPRQLIHNGIIIQNGVYTLSGTTQDPATLPTPRQEGIQFGGTPTGVFQAGNFHVTLKFTIKPSGISSPVTTFQSRSRTPSGNPLLSPGATCRGPLNTAIQASTRIRIPWTGLIRTTCCRRALPTTPSIMCRQGSRRTTSSGSTRCTKLGTLLALYD